MHRIYCILFAAVMLAGCGNTGVASQPDKDTSDSLVKDRSVTDIPVPFVMKPLQQTRFPASWANAPLDDQASDFRLETTSPNDYNRLFYFIHRFYREFYDSLPAVGSEVRTSTLSTSIDSARAPLYDSSMYFVCDFKMNAPGLRLALYKDAGRFRQAPLDESVTYLNYLQLFSFSGDRVVDSLTVYFEERAPIEQSWRFFMIDADMTLHLYSFKVEETETSFLSEERFRITTDGRFVPAG